MIKILSKIFLCFFFLFIVSGIATPQPIDAFYVRVENPYKDQILNLAIVHYDDNANKWLVRGWYRVNPRSPVQNFFFNFSNKMDYVYIHAFAENASWGSEENFTVRKDNFEYYIGEECPAAPERRLVGFDKYYQDKNGYVYWKTK